MKHNLPENRKIISQCGLGLCFVCMWLGLGLVPAVAEDAVATKGSAATAENNRIFSTENLQKQISDLDGQIQKLREQSMALQEKTRAKLQSHLEMLRRERDILLPRIKKLRDNSARAWQDVKENIQKAIEDLKASVDTMEK